MEPAKLGWWGKAAEMRLKKRCSVRAKAEFPSLVARRGDNVQKESSAMASVRGGTPSERRFEVGKVDREILDAKASAYASGAVSSQTTTASAWSKALSLLFDQ